MTKILHIEDDNNFRDSISCILEDEGFEMIPAGSGKDGLNRIMENSPDIVLCDVRLPDKSGFEILMELKSSKINTPFIFLTGLNDDESIMKGTRLNADDYLSKSVKSNVLVAKIRSAIARREMAVEPHLKKGGGLFQEIEKIKEGLVDIMDYSCAIKTFNSENKMIVERLALRCIDLLFFVDSIEKDIVSEAIKEGVTDECVDIKLLIESILAFVKKNDDKAKKLKVFISEGAGVPLVDIDQKYFAKVLEEIICRIVDMVDTESLVNIKIDSPYLEKIIVSFDVPSIGINEAQGIYSDSFVCGALELQGIDFLSEDGRITLSIPGYRIADL